MLDSLTTINQPVTEAVLCITEKCNLNCSYCYASKSEKTMDFSTARKVIELLLNEPAPNNHTINISFFGGEPLMEFGLMKKVVDYALTRGREENRNFTFGFVSNMTLINDDILEFLKKNNFSILASIDGGQKVHDENRTFTNGKGSFDTVVRNIVKIVNLFGNLRLRMTLSPYHIGSLSESIQYLDTLGLVSITLTPDIRVDWKEAIESGALTREYLKLSNMIIEGFRRGRLPSLVPLSAYIVRYGASLVNLQTQVQDQHTCRAGQYSITVDPSGNIIPCHQFYELNDYKLGDCDNGINFNRRKTFINLSSDSFKYCNNCDIYELCSGPCVGASALFSGGLYEPHKIFCEISRCRAKAARYIHSTLTMEDNELFLRAMSHIKTDKFPVCN